MGNQQLKERMIIINTLEKRIASLFPNEKIKVVHYKTMREEATIQCLICGTEYTLKAAQGFLKRKCLCKKCFNNGSGGRLDKHTVEQKLKKAYPNEDLKVINYTLMKEPCDVQCKKCGHIYHFEYGENMFLSSKKKICSWCFPNKNEQTLRTIQQFKKYIDASEDFQLIDDLNNLRIQSDTLIKCKCNYCQRINEKTMFDYMRGRKCTCTCTNTLLTNEEFQEELGNEYTLIGDYYGHEKEVMLRHELCGFCYKTKGKWHSCPRCHGSKGEKSITFYLTQHEIKFEREKLVVIDTHKLRFDFFLSEFNLFIEFQGEQHYQPVAKFGGEVQFKLQQEYDNLKREWCKNNQIILLEIRYDEDIQTVLDNYFLKFNDHPLREYTQASGSGNSL